MMHNKNIYKKLCTATISLGLLFSIGQFTYAHDPNLRAAEQLAASNPTLENLKHLCSLYEIDIKQHYAKGENDEAKEAEQELQKTQVQIITKYEDNLKYQIEAAEENAYKAQLIAFFDETSKNYALLIQHYDAVAELAKTHTKYSKKAIEYQIKAAEAKAKQANLTIVESRWSEQTAEQYEALAQRWDAVVELAKSNQKYSKNLLKYQIKAAEARANQLDVTIRASAWDDRTAEQYETLAQRWDALAELAQSHPTYSQNVLEYQIEAAETIETQLDIIDRHNTTAEQYEALAQRWDAVVELAKSNQKYSKNLLKYQIKAAKARARQQNRIISHNGRTPGNYETLAQLYDEISQSYNLDGQYADAAHYKLSAIRTMLSMVNLTEDFNEKCNAYKRAIAYNDNAATFAEESGWPHDSVVNFRIKAAKSRIELAETILKNNKPTLQNYDNWVGCCEELVQLFDGNDRDNLRIDAAIARVNAAKARAKRAKFIAEQRETVENYDMLMQCWNEVAELSEIVINEHTPEAFLQYEVVEEARREAELAMDKRDFAAMIRQSTFLSIAALLGKK